jgi:hypothetical protein
MNQESAVDRPDIIELARGRDEAWHGEPTAPPLANCDPEPPIAELSPEQTLDAMYECAVNIRLELVYSPTISSDFRKRWANRLGDVNLQAAMAATQIQRLSDELEAHESGCDSETGLDVAEIRHRLWRLRELSLHYQKAVASNQRSESAPAPSDY